MVFVFFVVSFQYTRLMRQSLLASSVIIALAIGARAQTGVETKPGLAPTDLHRLQAVGSVQLSPDGTHVAYSITHNERPGRPYSDTWIRDLATGRVTKLNGGAGPRWSRDGRWVAYQGRLDDVAGLIVADQNGEGERLVAPIEGTNHPLPTSGETIAWSPDGRSIAFVSAEPGPETENANGDPMVITRYLYKPTAFEGLTRFNDNKRLHVYVVDLGSRQVRQLTAGTFYEHSLDWSPKGDELVFVSNREPDADKTFNYDVFVVRVKDAALRRLTNTKSAEYFPVWSPDGTRIAFLGTRRDLTSSETTMEDTHVWVMNADGSNRIEIGAGIDNRQGDPQWSPEGTSVYFSVQERGSTQLMRLPVPEIGTTANALAADLSADSSAVAGAKAEARSAKAEPIVAQPGSLGSWSVETGKIAYAFATPGGPSELFLKVAGDAPAVQLTTLNKDFLATRSVSPVEAFTFKSFDGTEIEAFLTRPGSSGSTGPAGSVPMIVVMHGGPHGQQGPAFNSKAQVYAGLGWATLMVNYRGSTGYGQKLTDAIFKDQNGGEAKDVLAGVDAALARYPWLDGGRMGLEGSSYGGQLANWIVTQTPRFKASVPSAGISNLITQNYLSYYHDYLAVEYGAFPHDKGVIDQLWERSAIRYANKVKTPTLFVHGENDNDVPIAEAEQFFIALKDVGVDTVMLRYPREGHGLRETRHVVDALERSIAWYKKYFR
jgi:dipeptidyl aminopeptidase/acylaminoacyl peptidase